MLATPEKTSTTSRSRGVLAMFEAKIEFAVCPNNSKTGGASSKPPLLVPTSGAPGASTKLLMDEKHSHTTQKSERALRARIVPLDRRRQVQKLRSLHGAT